MARHSIPDIIDQADLRPGEIRTAQAPVVSSLVRSLRPSSEVINLLSDVHRQIANLLHAMPATAAPELARLGLIENVRNTVSRHLQRGGYVRGLANCRSS